MKNKVTLVDSGTSPAKCEFTHAAASPIMFEPLSPTRKPKIDVDDYTLNFKTMVDRAVSPIKCTDFLKLAKFGNNQSSFFHNDKIAKNDPHEDNNDREIELIFRNMRFEHSLITPMPTSPSRLSDIDNRSLSTVFESCEGADFTKLQDENKRLQSDVVLIRKEMMKLKRFVQSMGLKEEFNKFMNITIMNEINAMDSAALEIVQMENPVSPVHSIDNDDNITLDLDDYEDHVTDTIPPVNNDDLLFAEPDETQVETLTEESSNVECTENDQVFSCKNYETSKKITKARKLSKLDKLRKRMLPKSKIRRLAGPAKRFLRSMTKRLSPYSRSSPVLSKQQEAYSKAVLIWKQLNSKKKVSPEKDNAKPSISKETKTPNTDKNKIQSQNELCSNKFENKLNNNSQLQKQINKSWQSSESGGRKESYGNKTRKSSTSLPDSPHADSNNINSLDSDKVLFVVLEPSLNEKVQRLQKEHIRILNTDNDTVQLPKGAKSPKVNPIAETETSSKRMLRSSSTTERNEDNANKSKTENMVLYSDVKSPPKSEPENIIQTRKSLRRASQEARENCYEKIISNNKDTSNENVSSDCRERRKHLNKTQIQCRRLLRSSNQVLDSPNSSESQKIGSSVSRTDTKQPDAPSQQQGSQSTTANNTLTCSDRYSRRSSIQQSDKNTLQGDCDKIDNETSSLKRKGLKRKNEDIPAIQSKRTLRSSTVLLPLTRNNNDNMEAKPSSATYNEMLRGGERKEGIDDPEKETKRNESNATTNEKDSSIFLTFSKNQSNKNSNHVICQEAGEERKQNVHTVDKRQNSILCKGIEKYGFNHEKNSKKKLPGINFFKCFLLCI